jgi:hypothetical protein
VLATLHGWISWPASAFAATSLYLLGASLQLAVVAGQRRA